MMSLGIWLLKVAERKDHRFKENAITSLVPLRWWGCPLLLREMMGLTRLIRMVTYCGLIHPIRSYAGMHVFIIVVYLCVYICTCKRSRICMCIYSARACTSLHALIILSTLTQARRANMQQMSILVHAFTLRSFWNQVRRNMRIWQ